MRIIDLQIALVSFDDIQNESYILIFHVWIAPVGGRDRGIKCILRLRIIPASRESCHGEQRLSKLRDRVVFLYFDVGE